MSTDQGAAPAAAGSDARPAAIIGYGLYLFGWPSLHLATIAGLVLAYIKRDDCRGTIWETHFTNQIETFWTSLALGVVGAILCLTVVGLVVGLPLIAVTVLWFLYRSIRGLIRAIESRPCA